MTGTTLSFVFPWGRYHATAWNRNANEGAPDWPPAPWRVLRALYAAWRWHCQDLAEDQVVPLLAKLAVPPQYNVPRFRLAHTRHYLPGDDHKPGLKTDVDKTFDCFVVTERGAELLVNFPVELDHREREVLARITENVAYLGRAESLVEATLVVGSPPTDGWLVAASSGGSTISSDGGLRLLGFSEPLDHGAIVARPRDVRSQRRQHPPGTRWINYPRLEESDPSYVPPPRATVRVAAVRFSVSGSALPSRNLAVALGDVLRRSCLSAYGGTAQDVSPILAGKLADGTKREGRHEHAHYLAFSAVGNPKLLDTMLVWAPNGLSARELGAVARPRSFRVGENLDGVNRAEVAVEGLGSVEDVAPELVGPASVWRSLTPFAPTRNRQSDLTALVTENVRRELEYRGRDDILVGVEIVKGDWLSFRRYRLGEPLSSARRAFGVELHFSEPVRGPLCLGKLSHFGLGLFMPATP